MEIKKNLKSEKEQQISNRQKKKKREINIKIK